ncbi:MAG: hypothetical protein DMF53_06680 [Acidobacteria bacterium]|nr:MAG: hypothetical protein DMF53_06680 [Acidobacteriota bacterium]
MIRLILRAAALGILLASVAALPAAAQVINPGNDFWTTPANGQTYFTFPSGDVESLCGAVLSNTWDHKLVLQGTPLGNPAYDTVVARLDQAVFDPTGTATTRVVVKALSFGSSAPQATPCGTLTWTAGLAGNQGITTMTLHRTSATGGYFNADLSVAVELRATDANGKYIGSLFYNFALKDPGGSGTPWSIDQNGVFRAGMTPANDCIAVLRQKLAATPTDSQHYYYISDMIARGQCKQTG